MHIEISGHTLNLAVKLANTLNNIAKVDFKGSELKFTALNNERTARIVLKTIVATKDQTEFSGVLNVKHIKNLIAPLSSQVVEISADDTGRLLMESEYHQFKIPLSDSSLLDEGKIEFPEPQFSFTTRLSDLVKLLNTFKEISREFSFEITNDEVYVKTSNESYDLRSHLPTIELSTPNYQERRLNGIYILPALSILKTYQSKVEVRELLRIFIQEGYEELEGYFEVELLLAPIVEMEDISYPEGTTEEFTTTDSEEEEEEKIIDESNQSEEDQVISPA